MLFNLPPELPPPPAKAIARQMLERANDDLARMIADHKDSFNALWSNPHATPAEILEHMGLFAGPLCNWHGLALSSFWQSSQTQ